MENMGPTTADNVDFGPDFDQSLKQLQDYWDKQFRENHDQVDSLTQL